MLRVLIPVVAVIGIGAIVALLVLIMNNRTEIAQLGPEVATAESRVAQLQRDVTQLGADVESVKGIADALDNRLTAIERGRSMILSDLREVTSLAGQSVSLGTVSHTGSSVALNGGTPDVDDIFRYARALRESEEAPNDLRFSSVWITSIAGEGTAFNIDLTK
jgi:Tfp pilus assembly protein PilN